MIFYGLADYMVGEVVDFFPNKEAAEEALRQVLLDEPAWEGGLEVVAVDFSAGPVGPGCLN